MTQAKFGLKLAENLLEFFAKYFGVPYPLPKLGKSCFFLILFSVCSSLTGSHDSVVWMYTFTACSIAAQGYNERKVYILCTYWNQFSLGGICKQE